MTERTRDDLRQRSTQYLGRGQRGVDGYVTRANTGFIRERTIDMSLNDEELLSEIYDKWDAEKWEEPLTFQGGVRGITCEMILRVPLSELGKVYGAERASFLVEIARKGANPALVEK